VTRGLLVWALVAFVCVFGIMVVQGIPGRDYLDVEVSAPEVGNLLTHDPVRIGGARVGQVLRREVGNDGRARLKLQLDPGLTISDDARVKIRANGLLGARYLELIPGRSPRMLDDGDRLVASDTALTYGVPDALDTFDRETRGALRPLITQAGTGLLTNGAPLNEAIARGSEEIVPFQQLVDDIFARPGALERLVPSLGATFKPLRENRAALSRLPAAIGAGFRPLATETDGMRDTLEIAPSALRAADTGLAKGARLVGELDTLTRRLRTTLPGAPAALRATTRLLRRSQKPLVAARGVLDEVPPVVPAALRLTRNLAPALPFIRRTVEPLFPMLAEVTAHGCDIKNFAAGFRSMTGMGGEGEGPNGPAGEFRLLLVAPTGSDALGIDAPVPAPLRREGYPAPCKHAHVTYETFPGLYQLPPSTRQARRKSR